MLIITVSWYVMSIVFVRCAKIEAIQVSLFFSTPAPLAGENYFSGGYNTNRYGSDNGGTIDGIQIECNSNLRFNTTARKAFADSLALVILDYLDEHYFTNLSPNYCTPTTIKKVSSVRSKVNPNPAKDYLYIHSRNYPLEATIYNQLGQLVGQKTIASIQDKLDLSQLEYGVFYVELKGAAIMVQTQKVVGR